MAKRIGLYPGTFDPVTLGHLDIVKRAFKLVDHLVIGLGTGTGKNPLFPSKSASRCGATRRRRSPRVTCRSRSSAFHDKLQVDLAREVGASMIVRGLRAVSDFEYEFQMVGMNQRLAPEIETVFLDGRSETSGHRLQAGQGGRRCWAAMSRRS